MDSHLILQQYIRYAKTIIRITKMPEENPLRPEYYNPDHTYEPIKVIKSWALGFNLGNTLKYIARPRKAKDTTKRVEDLGKAMTYLQFEIDNLLEDTQIDKILGD